MRYSGNMVPATEARGRNSREMLIGRDGHVNANNKNDLMKKLVEIASMIEDGEIASADTMSAREVANENASALREAYHDTGAKWAELGAAITSDIDSRLEREGFMRSVLDRGTLNDGERARIRVRENNVTAIVSRGPVQVYPRYLREKFIDADEFYISAHPRVEELDLRQGTGDLLEEKYFEGLEAILVQEDRTLIKMLRNADGFSNTVSYFSGAFTPTILQAAKTKVEQWRLPVGKLIMSIDLLNDLVAGTDYSTWFDPISKWEIVQTGRIGRLLGMDILTDGYRETTLQVLDPGEFLVMTTGNYLGSFTDRGPVQSRPVDQFDDFVPARGWSMMEMVSMVVASTKGIARGKRQ